MELISMTDFVLQQDITDVKQRDSIVKYANFLKQPLKLEMFVPCDEDGNILEKPDLIDERYNLRLLDYEQAKEKVLFEGFEIAINKEGERVILGDYTCLKVSNLENWDIEYLVKYVHIKLTPNAIKQLGL